MAAGGQRSDCGHSQDGCGEFDFFPGNAYSGAHGWVKGTWYGKSNGSVMQKIHDPKSNYVYEVHQYLDKDSSGTHKEVVRRTIGSERLRELVKWSRQNKEQKFAGWI